MIEISIYTGKSKLQYNMKRTLLHRKIELEGFTHTGSQSMNLKRK